MEHIKREHFDFFLLRAVFPNRHREVYSDIESLRHLNSTELLALYNDLETEGGQVEGGEHGLGRQNACK